MNPQVFWTIQSLTDKALAINGVSLSNPSGGLYTVNDLPTINTNYDIVLDDTNVNVLTVVTSTPVTLTLRNSANQVYTAASAVASFAGGRPIRKVTFD